MQQLLFVLLSLPLCATTPTPDLHTAVEQSSVKEVARLLSAGANPWDYQEIDMKFQNDGENAKTHVRVLATPLLQAIITENHAIVEKLYAAGLTSAFDISNGYDQETRTKLEKFFSYYSPRLASAIEAGKKRFARESQQRALALNRQLLSLNCAFKDLAPIINEYADLPKIPHQNPTTCVIL